MKLQSDDSLLAVTGFETVEIEDLLNLGDLAELGAELTNAVKDMASVICPHCGGEIHV